MAEEREHPGVRYEHRDITFRWVLALLLLIAAFLIGMSLLMLKFFWMQEEAERRLKGSTEALAPALPPEPRLEQIDALAGVEAANVNARLAAQEEKLNSYGPTGEKGFVHIPIRQAIEAVADKLPVREPPPNKLRGSERQRGEGR